MWNQQELALSCATEETMSETILAAVRAGMPLNKIEEFLDMIKGMA